MTDPDFDPEANEPVDYDGYVDYVCGRAPGVDGRTFVNGTVAQKELVR